ncbi:MAG: hypothetical protein CFH44_01126 [Proteobacteria bacterium]|nr:MAG: hypothetical protein CFH44_01126 [Pseudomonadota bacterium]
MNEFILVTMMTLAVVAGLSNMFARLGYCLVLFAMINYCSGLANSSVIATMFFVVLFTVLFIGMARLTKNKVKETCIALTATIILGFFGVMLGYELFIDSNIIGSIGGLFIMSGSVESYVKEHNLFEYKKEA